MKQRPRAQGHTANSSPPLQGDVQLDWLAKLDQAERLCKEILATQPANFAALHRLGVIQCQQGRPDEALISLRAAVRLGPTQSAAWSDFGVVHATMGCFDQAVGCFDKAIALDPVEPTPSSTEAPRSRLSSSPGGRASELR